MAGSRVITDIKFMVGDFFHKHPIIIENLGKLPNLKSKTTLFHSVICVKIMYMTYVCCNNDSHAITSLAGNG